MKTQFKMEELMEILTYLAGKKCPICGSEEIASVDLITLGAPTSGAPLPTKLLVECKECGYNMIFKNVLENVIKQGYVCRFSTG